MDDKLFSVSEIINNFDLDGEFTGYEVSNNGHINNTFILDFDDSGRQKQYILQQINVNVFKDPDKLMANFVGVTGFLRKKIIAAGGNPKRETLKIYFTVDGKPYYLDSQNRYWRIMNYVIDTFSCDLPDDHEICRNAGRAFGKFQGLLADYPIDSLYETIKNFHHTVSRFADFKKAIEDNLSGRLCNVGQEVSFALEREADCGVLLSLLERGELPMRVTHNDTKLNNVLFDKSTREGICVIDLDTVMPGLSLYDFGDSLRFAGNTASEDEKDLSKVSFDTDIYKCYTEGYLSEAGESLTEAEISYLPFSCKLMTLECGIRFLTDYLNGDTYFKTAYPEHNLDRCRTQFALVADIEKKYDELVAITHEINARLKKERASK